MPWTGENATVRVIGAGAGNFTYVLMGGAGHMVSLVRTSLHGACRTQTHLAGYEGPARACEEGFGTLDRQCPFCVGIHSHRHRK